MNIITDEILKIMQEANPLYSVIFIYAFTKKEEIICPLEYAKNFNTTEEEVIRAFQYFQLKRLIHLKIEEKLHVEFIEKGVEKNEKQESEKVVLHFKPEINYEKNENYEKTLYSPEEIAHYQSFPEVRTIFDMAEQILGNLLTPMQQSVILSYYEEYLLDEKTIKEILTYAKLKNKTRPDSLDEIARNWSEIEKENKNNNENKNIKEILDAMGISKRDITQKITSKIDEWLKIHTHEMVLEACDRTIMKFAKPNPVYTEGILKDWDKNGIKTIEQMIAHNETHSENQKKPKKSKFNNYENKGIDYSKIVEKLQNNY